MKTVHRYLVVGQDGDARVIEACPAWDRRVQLLPGDVWYTLRIRLPDPDRQAGTLDLEIPALNAVAAVTGVELAGMELGRTAPA